MCTRVDGTAAFLVLTLLLGCGGEMHEQTTPPFLTLGSVTTAEWQRLASRRIFFGHQSVGGNVIDGVQELLRANPQIPLRIVQTADPAQMREPAIYHALIGKNEEPATKLSEFKRIVSAGVVDSGIAMLKFCYIDVSAETDPLALFAEYRRTVDSLRAAHPGLTIVHITLPLQIDPGTLFHWRTVMWGKVTPYRTLNGIRARYNSQLRATYGGHEPMFDLARLESTLSDGRIRSASYHGAPVPSLAAEWTTDGGHLNEAGRRRIAEAFLVMLAQLR